MEISFEGDVTLVVCSLTEKRLFTHFVYGRPTKTNMGPASYIQELMMAYQFLAEIFSRCEKHLFAIKIVRVLFDEISL